MFTLDPLNTWFILYQPLQIVCIGIDKYARAPVCVWSAKSVNMMRFNMHISRWIHLKCHYPMTQFDLFVTQPTYKTASTAAIENVYSNLFWINDVQPLNHHSVNAIHVIYFFSPLVKIVQSFKWRWWKTCIDIHFHHGYVIEY